ncbi:MAG: lipid A biosynthesis acyltransferase [Pseudomonadota bacterium]|nr:MAG: lipid A biosynthesis acyltransferase [Pseudomonadota bacterium]
MNRKWREQHERGSASAIRLIRWIALHLGRTPTRLLLHPITAYFLLTSSEGRRCSRQFLARATGKPPNLWNIARHIHSFASTILDRVYFCTDRFQYFDLQVHGHDMFDETMAQGSGCILLGSHLGSFEVLRMLALSHKRLPLKVLMDKERSETITRLLEALNPEIADSVISPGTPDVLLKVHEHLERGGMVGMLGDRTVPQDRVVHCRFFERDAPFPAAPFLLASVLKVPVILFFGLYRGGNRYDIHFEKLANRITVRRGRREADARHWAQQYAARLESHARRAPYNWFNFYDFWPDDIHHG